MPRPTSDRKAQLCDAAIELFHTQGFAKVSIRDIAQAADVPLGAVYYYYPSKGALAVDVASARRHAITAALQEIKTNEASPALRLQQLTAKLTNVAEQVKQAGCPIAKLLIHLAHETGEEERRAFSQATQIYQDMMDFVNEQALLLGYSKDEASQAAQHYVALWQGCANLAVAFDTTQPIKTLLESAVESLCRASSPSKPTMGASQ